MTKQVCPTCGVEWIDGKGWAGNHKELCANDRYGWQFTVEGNDDGCPILHPPGAVSGVMRYIPAPNEKEIDAR